MKRKGLEQIGKILIEKLNKKVFYYLPLALTMMFIASSSMLHPYYVSISELKFTSKDKHLSAVVRMFTNDLENGLKKSYSIPVNLLKPKDKVQADSLLRDYIFKRLKLKVNDKQLALKWLGYEQNDDAIWSYIEVENIEQPKKIEVENKLLFDYLPKQINIVSVSVDDRQETKKVNFPDYKMSFHF